MCNGRYASPFAGHLFQIAPPTEDTTSFFSFYDVTEKIGIIIGISLFGVIDQITGSMRNSILFFLVLFLAGGFMLTRVPIYKNRKGLHSSGNAS